MRKLSEEESRHLKETELDILLEIKRVCDELGVLGKPANTKVGITIDTDWFWGLVEECVRGYIKTH